MGEARQTRVQNSLGDHMRFEKNTHIPSHMEVNMGVYIECYQGNHKPKVTRIHLSQLSIIAYACLAGKKRVNLQPSI